MWTASVLPETTVKAASSPAELRLRERNSTIVIFLAIRSKSFMIRSLLSGLKRMI
jgi:hypothetical protein